MKNAVESYHITASNSARFWAPYLRNDNYTQDPTVPRGLGKASAEEIKQAAEYIVSVLPSADAETIRQKLVDGSLQKKDMNYKGVDCSGFVYHVMNKVYQEVLGKELMDDLSVPKDHVLNGALNLDEWKAAYELSEDEAVSLPHDVPMRWVVETFKRKPVNLCRVAGLTSDYSSHPIKVSDMRVGDLIDLIQDGSTTPHVAIVMEIQNGSAQMAHSGRRDQDDIGGVSIETVAILNDSLDTESLGVPRKFKEIRRLRSLQ